MENLIGKRTGCRKRVNRLGNMTIDRLVILRSDDIEPSEAFQDLSTSCLTTIAQVSCFKMESQICTPNSGFEETKLPAHPFLLVKSGFLFPCSALAIQSHL